MWPLHGSAWPLEQLECDLRFYRKLPKTALDVFLSLREAVCKSHSNLMSSLHLATVTVGLVSEVSNQFLKCTIHFPLIVCYTALKMVVSVVHFISFTAL